MGHDHHFLSRLDRVSSEQVELALGLYNDAELVKTILTRAKLPDEAERIAISMHDPTLGPFIIVERNGRFVTCLGPGMRASNLPVVTRGELDTIATKLNTLRDHIKRARAATPTNSELARLMLRIGKAGNALPREDFAMLKLWAPMMWTRFLTGYFSLYDQVEKQRIELMHYDGHKESDEVLQNFWNQVHGLGHLLVLAASGDPEEWVKISAKMGELGFGISRPAIAQDMMSVAVRGAWSAAYIGPCLIPAYEKSLEADELMETSFDGVLGLFAIGVRHESARAHVKEFLTEGRERWGKAGGAYGWRSWLADTVLPMLDGPTDVSRHGLDVGREMVTLVTPLMPKESPFRFGSRDAIPDDVALCALANFPLAWRNESNPAVAVSIVQQVARLDAESLYAPRGLAKAVCVGWERKLTLDLLERFGKRRVVETVRAAPRVGRNDPCPCESGKKYKKCHGR